MFYFEATLLTVAELTSLTDEYNSPTITGFWKISLNSSKLICPAF
jgi:hypothetical protein